MLDNAGSDEIDIEPIEFGPRSRLVKPALFGTGSKSVESLISYIVRIGAAHHVSPMRMLKTIYAPENAVIKGCMYPSFFNYYASTVNGLSKYAQVFVTATENLTGASHLKRNTLLPLMHLLPSTGCGLISDHPQWCPECVQEMLVSHGQSYRPLIWSLKLYRACTKHHKPLVETCPHCDLIQPFIMHYPDLSRCAYCYQGLNVRGDDDPVEYSEFDYWVFSAIEDLICHLNEWDSVATVDTLTKFLRYAISHYANGNGTSFCKQIGLSSWAIKGWLNKGEKPSLPQLLSVCYGLDMFLSDVFLNTSQAFEFSGHILRKLPEKMLDRAERPLLVPAQRIELLETLTKFAEDRNEHRPLSEIAKLLNFTGSCLRYWFPEQCARISSKHADYKRISGIINQESSVNKVKLIVDELKAGGVYVSNRKVNNRLLLEGKTLAKPVLYKAFKKLRDN